jgi:hypothetical protein
MFYPPPVPTEADIDELSEGEETESQPNKLKVLLSAVFIIPVAFGLVFLATAEVAEMFFVGHQKAPTFGLYGGALVALLLIGFGFWPAIKKASWL